MKGYDCVFAASARAGALVLAPLLALVPLLTLASAPAGAAEGLEVTVSSGPRPLLAEARSCDPDDFPDSPARAIRSASGEVVLFAGHYRARADRGPSLAALRHECPVAFEGRQSSDPRDFDARAWLAALWTEDGTRVAAIVHNEFQAHRYPGRCRFPTYLACWYSFLTLAASSDGARHFAPVAPGSPMLAPNSASEEGQGRPRGFFGASNLVRSGDAVYAVTMTTGENGQPRGNCLIRSRDPFANDGWEILTDQGYVRTDTNPYKGETRPACRVLANLHGDVTALVRHRASGLFVAAYIMPGGPKAGTVSYVTSSDLVTWSAPRDLVALPTQFSTGCAKERYIYPTLFDPGAETRSFEDVGDRALLVMVHADLARCNTMTNRRLEAFDLQITRR